MRKRIWEWVEVKKGQASSLSNYNKFIIGVILTAIIPLCFRTQTLALRLIDGVTGCFFCMDYLFRWSTADYKYHFKGKRWIAFFYYLVTPYAVIDLCSILPGIGLIFPSLLSATVFRLFRAIRVLKILRYTNSFNIAIRAFRKEKRLIYSVFFVAMAYIVISAFILYQVEPSSTFHNLFDAFYWATTELTTVGYGDIYPVSSLGRLLGMMSAFVGIAVIALPSGIVTAGYMTEFTKAQQAKIESERKLKEMQEQIDQEGRKQNSRKNSKQHQKQTQKRKKQQGQNTIHQANRGKKKPVTKVVCKLHIQKSSEKAYFIR